ncbi:hypothetical protein N8260_03790, partial [Amylibacter sp.]|nr:hypothetical protein [Amylibacter sp.]
MSTYYVLDASDNSIRLSSDYITNMTTNLDWVPLQVEGGEHFGGFEVLMQSEAWAGTQFGYYSYRFNTSSEHVGNKAAGIARHESWFQFDLDGNGSITISPGQVPMLTDISGNQHHIDDGHGSVSIIIKKDNVTIDPNSNGGLSATQVIANASGSYDVLWTDPTGNKYDVWEVNTSGNFVSSIKTKLWQDEEKFSVDLDEHGVKIEVDINGDGDTGLQLV